jgi:hypothetical protein
MPVKTKKVWKFVRREDRMLEAYLNGLSEKGESVFSVTPSASIGGSWEVLSFHTEKVVVVPLTKEQIAAKISDPSSVKA